MPQLVKAGSVSTQANSPLASFVLTASMSLNSTTSVNWVKSYT